MTTTGRLLATALILVLGGCGSGEPSSGPGRGAPGGSASSGTASTATSQTPDAGASPVPRAVTPADDGARFTMAVGTTTTLRVQDPSAADPAVTGEAVLLVPVVNVTDSGGREWELRGVAAGPSTVTGGDPGYSFTITVG